MYNVNVTYFIFIIYIYAIPPTYTSTLFQKVVFPYPYPSLYPSFLATLPETNNDNIKKISKWVEGVYRDQKFK